MRANEGYAVSGDARRAPLVVLQGDLAGTLEKLGGLIERLGERLEAVLGPDRPSADPHDKPPGLGNSPLAGQLASMTLDTERLCARVTDLIERLEL